jgi:hypothetical protein
MRRVRGALLRLVRRRSFSVLIGAALLIPAAWIELVAVAAPWWAEGLSVVAAATGIALVWAGLRGPRPDWFDPA